MKVCPKCKAEVADPEVSFCSQCGASLTEPDKGQTTEKASQDDLDFVVTEATADDRDFVGGQKEFDQAREDLGIESTSDLMEKEAQSYSADNLDNPDARVDLGPIGDSSSPLPPQAEFSDQATPPLEKENTPPASADDEITSR